MSSKGKGRLTFSSNLFPSSKKIVPDLDERVDPFKHESEGELRLESHFVALRNEIHQMVGWASEQDNNLKCEHFPVLPFPDF